MDRCLSVAVREGGLVKVREWLICTPHFTLLCAVAHLDADVKRLVQCANTLQCGGNHPGMKRGCILFVCLFGVSYEAWQSFCLSSNFTLSNSMSSSLLSPFLPVHHGEQIWRHAENRKRLHNIIDIDITSVIIELKLTKWIANLRSLSHSILVCTNLRKCIGVCEYWWWDSVSSCLLLFIQSASLHFCQTPAYSQSTPKFNKLLCRHWSFSHTNICI